MALLSVAIILVALVVAHGLWERRRDAAARERVALFNIVTTVTLAIGVASHVVCRVLLALPSSGPRHLGV